MNLKQLSNSQRTGFARLLDGFASIVSGASMGAILMHLCHDSLWLPILLGFSFVTLSVLARYVKPLSPAQEVVEEINLKLDALRWRGLYPREGEGSDEDVKRLVQAGEMLLAIRLHKQLHAVSLQETKRALDAMR